MITEILVELQAKIDRGEETNCIASWVLKDQDANLSLREAVKCSMSMLQGGIETIPSHLFAGLGALLSPAGQEMQERAYHEIRDVYATDEEAIERCVSEEKVPYLIALYKEMLRYYAIVPFSLPRETTADIKLTPKSTGQEVTIPAGTYVYMNAEGGGHGESTVAVLPSPTHLVLTRIIALLDPKRFGPNAHVFEPTRWLNQPEINGPGLPHFAYGIGSRVCPAWQISNRIMYMVLLRLILAFRLLPDEKMPPPTDYVTYGETPAGVANAPKPFLVRFVPRSPERLRVMLDVEKQAYA